MVNMVNKMPKIDNKDLKLLSELDKNSRIHTTALAKKLRISRETTKYRLKKLTDNKTILSFTTVINPAKLGYTLYKVYLKLENQNQIDPEITKYITSNKHIFWATKCDGAFDIIFGAYVKDIEEFDSLMENFLEKFSKYITSKHISNSTYVNFFFKSYLDNSASQAIKWGGKPEQTQIDNSTKQILKILAKNSRTSIAEISESLSISPKTIISKIKKAEQQNIIQAYRILLDLEKINKENFKAIIYLKNTNKEKINEFQEFCHLNKNIQYYIKIIGEWDIELDIEIENFKEFNKLTHEIKNSFPSIIKDIIPIYMTDEIKGELNVAQII